MPRSLSRVNKRRQSLGRLPLIRVINILGLWLVIACLLASFGLIVLEAYDGLGR